MGKIDDLKKKIADYMYSKKSQKDIKVQYEINCKLAEEIAMLEANKEILEANGMGQNFKYCVATRSNNLLSLYELADTFDDYIEYFIGWKDGFTVAQRTKFFKMAKKKGQIIDKAVIQSVLEAPEPNEYKVKKVFGGRDEVGRGPWRVKVKLAQKKEEVNDERE